MQFLVTLSACLAVVAAKSSCPDPDGSREKIFATTCSASDPIQPQTITVTDNNGNTNYPIDVSKPIVITALSSNTLTSPVAALEASVDLYTWDLTNCVWSKSFLSIFLRGLDGCSIGGNCPLQPGPLTLKTAVDLSKWKNVIIILVNNNPYRLDIHLTDKSSGKEVACVKVEALIKK